MLPTIPRNVGYPDNLLSREAPVHVLWGLLVLRFFLAARRGNPVVMLCYVVLCYHLL